MCDVKLLPKKILKYRLRESYSKDFLRLKKFHELKTDHRAVLSEYTKTSSII